jgi:IMP dehydrogenase
MKKLNLDPAWIGKTFDDFLFRPQKGIVSKRSQIALTSSLTSSISLELPIVSSNMDSVTGGRMAETMALEGGLGVIHRGQSIEKQAQTAERVKRSHSAIIDNPLCLPLCATIGEARTFSREHNINGILIETKPGSNILAGVLTRRDMPWQIQSNQRSVKDFMTSFDDLRTAPYEISVDDADWIMFDGRVERLPLINTERQIQGLITRKDLRFLRESPYASKDAKGRLLVAAAIGCTGDYLERADELSRAGVDCFFVDIAHGHSKTLEQGILELKMRFPSASLIGGNVATGEGARFMQELGVDGVKVGVGPGRGCRTRLETAAGIPQLQAIREVWCAVGGEMTIMADGGIRFDKDIFLALACGADSVMLGSALSGTDEAPGKVIEDPASHTKKKIYRGMTSPEAVLESLYETSREESNDRVLDTPAEGQEIQVPYKGSVTDILHRIRGHLRSSVSYAGGESLSDVRRNILPNPLNFLIPLSAAAQRESYDR